MNRQSRNSLVLALVCVQLLLLAYMAGSREYVREYGQRIYLRTAPIDPRDPFRGDFVRLRYELSTVHPRQMRGDVHQHREQKGYAVYGVLKNSTDDLFDLDYLTDQRPSQGLFIKGRLSNRRSIGAAAAVNVKYGIEQYFVEQGKGLLIEETLGSRDDVQVPMEVELAVSEAGTAVLRGYRWSRLGIKLEIVDFNRRGADGTPQDPQAPLSPTLELTLKNVSRTPLTLVDDGQHCGFKLVAVNWSDKQYQPTSVCDGFFHDPLSPAQLHTLEPGQLYTVRLQLSDPRWHVKHQGSVSEVGALATADMFRLEYQSPERSRIDHLEPAVRANVWMGELPSRAFNAFGRID